jgi:hypothetical protein
MILIYILNPNEQREPQRNPKHRRYCSSSSTMVEKDVVDCSTLFDRLYSAVISIHCGVVVLYYLLWSLAGGLVETSELGFVVPEELLDEGVSLQNISGVLEINRSVSPQRKSVSVAIVLGRTRRNPLGLWQEPVFGVIWIHVVVVVVVVIFAAIGNLVSESPGAPHEHVEVALDFAEGFVLGTGPCVSVRGVFVSQNGEILEPVVEMVGRSVDTGFAHAQFLGVDPIHQGIGVPVDLTNISTIPQWEPFVL